MRKNGSYFLSLVDRSAIHPGVWDPYLYREKKQTETLGHFVNVRRVEGKSFSVFAFKYAPIEYRHIPRGAIPIFPLEPMASTVASNVHAVGEECLLFGTMRAYLGNTLVTPKGSWLGEKSPFFFAVKSEFIQVIPKDGLTYFWWAFLQSPVFLQSLPVGTGGTRPRLSLSSLLQTPIEVPLRHVRERIHRTLASYAEKAWNEYSEAEKLLDSTLR